MTAPLSVDAFLAARRAEGVRVAEHDGWRTHNRNHKGPWGPVHGVTCHHTAGVDSVTTMGRRLVAEGCGRYGTGPGPEWTGADRASYAVWRRQLGYRDAAADGIPGRASWERLRVPAPDPDRRPASGRGRPRPQDL